MALFEIGNQWWKSRTTHGREALFTEQEKLEAAAEEYFSITSQRKWVKKDWVGKDAVEVERENEVPYTINGLCIYLGVTYEWWRGFKNTETFKNNPDFASVYHMIEQIIYNQKFEGASVGAFNANIIARDLGLRDTKEIGNIPGESFNVTLDLK